MATIYPNTPAPDTKSSAEKRLHSKLAELPDAYTVFHSPQWIVPGREPNQPVTGEADFIVAHPDRGVIVLEVKGGSIEFDPGSGRWTSTGKSGTHEIKDPYRQARNNRYALKKVLDRLPGDRQIPVGEAVMFPDCLVGQADVPTTYDADLVLDRSNEEDLPSSIAKVFERWGFEKNAGVFGANGLARLERALAHEKIIRAPLGYLLADADQALVELTEQQFEVLTSLAQNNRVGVTGAAGTGKTLLAVEEARRLAAQGHPVLLTCFNVALAEFLQRATEDEPGITAIHYHGLCREWGNRAGLELPEASRSSDHYDVQLPNLLMDAAATVEDRFGAVVIDEAQDFKSDWFTSLELLLGDPVNGVVFMFGDDNQAIYGEPAAIPSNFARYRLTENCRNTQEIHKQLDTCFPGLGSKALGPDGINVEVLHWNDARSLASELSRVLHRWTREEAVAPEDITVLSGKRRSRSELARAERWINQFEFVHEPVAPNQIRYRTVQSFKGLESPVVILCELDDLPEGRARELWYTAMSRARVHLILLTTHGNESGDRTPSELVELACSDPSAAAAVENSAR